MNANIDGMNKPSPTSSNNAPSANDSDQDFDPTAEMLINDFDDEHTLEEEEANDDCSNITNEIMDLKKEGEMPLEELLALYGYEQSGKGGEKPVQGVSQGTSSANQSDSNSEESNSNCSYMDETSVNASQENHNNQSSNNKAATHPSTTTRSSKHLEELPSQWSLPQASANLTATNLLIDQDVSDMEDEEDDEDDDEDEDEGDWRRTIQVGSDYQAVIPDGLNGYGNVPPYENEDKLLWDPSALPEEVVISYLRQIASIDVTENLEPVSSPNGTNGVSEPSTVPPPSASLTTNISPLKDTTNLRTTTPIRDDEAALYLLHQCGHNVEEALRRKRVQQNSPFETMSPWSEEECLNFEDGIRLYGKDFHQIQKNKVPTRSVGELVQFYYLWKKTERHDVYASKWRIEKKKYSLHPGTTDYMDRFIDEQENLALQAHSISTSNYTRQQSHSSYSIIHYNHNSSSGSAVGTQQSSNAPVKENSSSETITDSGLKANGNGSNPGKMVGSSASTTTTSTTTSNVPENSNRPVGLTGTTNDSLNSGVARDNVQINSSNSNPSKTTVSSSDLYSPQSKMRMNMVDR